MKCYKLALLLGLISFLNPACLRFAKKNFSQIETDIQIVSEELLTKLSKKRLEYKDSKWPKDIASKKVDFAKIPDEVLQESIGWLQTMIKDKWLPTDIKEKWYIGIRKEEYPAADYLICRYKVDGYKIQVQENGVATCILIESPNSVKGNQIIEDFITSTIYKFLNYPEEEKDFLKFYLKNFEHCNKKVYWGTVDCAFDITDKEARSKRTWWNHTFVWADGRRVYFSLVNFDGKPREKTHARPGIKRRFEETNKIQQPLISVKDETVEFGDDAVEPIMNRIRSGANYRYAHKAVKTLAGIKTEKSQAALLGLALGKNFPERPNGDSWAARNYLKNLQNKSDAWELLASDNDKVLSVAIRFLQGEPVDSNNLEKLDILLQSKNSHLRANVVRFIALEPEGLSLNKKISLMTGSLKTVSLMPSIYKKKQAHMLGTQENLLYCDFIDYLTQIDGAKKYLHKQINEVDGQAQVAIKIALAKLGDATYKQDIKEFLNNEDMYASSKMRLYALRTFMNVGTQDDLAFLENLAKNDPVEVVEFKGRLYELTNGEFIHEKDKSAPVSHSDWPQNPESVVEVNYNPKPCRYYLIRSEAKKIIPHIYHRHTAK